MGKPDCIFTRDELAYKAHPDCDWHWSSDEGPLAEYCLLLQDAVRGLLALELADDGAHFVVGEQDWEEPVIRALDLLPEDEA